MGRILPALLISTLAMPVVALYPGDKVDNFKLLDQNGRAHELYYHRNAKAIVLMAHGGDCPAASDATSALAALQDRYRNDGTVFMLVDSTPGRDATATSDIPVLVDDTQLIGESLALRYAGEVLLIDPENWRLAYRGAPGDALAAALDATIAGNPVAVAQTEATGCSISLPAKAMDHQQISYANRIAPILMENCVTCHRPGGIGPWAMTSYDMIRGFGPMIREVVRTRRMPPWHADPQVGHFANDRSLSVEETRDLVHWIEAGAPRGEGPDPLLTRVEEAPEWRLGEPDLVIEVPAYDVPATGVVDYQYLKATNPLDHDVWVRAAEFQPGDRQAVHHVITRFTVPVEDGETNAFGRRARRGGGGFGGYVPGAEATEMPEGTGVLMPAGAVFSFQMHYTPYGKPTTDKSRLGIYFHDEPPAHPLAGHVLINGRFRIPPYASDYSADASFEFPRDAMLYSLFPHAHYRGKAARFDAVFPDGTTETLLNVPNYDFNWQTSYRLAEPRLIPKGTRVTFTMTWDNSPQNPANPDPSKTVRWGQQSWNEMLFGTLSFRYLEDEGQDGNAVAQSDVD